MEPINAKKVVIVKGSECAERLAKAKSVFAEAEALRRAVGFVDLDLDYEICEVQATVERGVPALREAYGLLEELAGVAAKRAYEKAQMAVNDAAGYAGVGEARTKLDALRQKFDAAKKLERGRIGAYRRIATELRELATVVAYAEKSGSHNGSSAASRSRKAEKAECDRQLRGAMKGASSSAPKFGGGSSRKSQQKQAKRQNAYA